MTMTRSRSPQLGAAGLVTVAFLKARLDEGSDHLGIFMPLIVDVVTRLEARSFTAAEVQESLAENHGLVMPQEAVTTLLKRATRNYYLVREAGRYRRNADLELPSGDLAAEKARILEAQIRLADALRAHAARRGLILESTEAALELLVRLLEAEQVALLLAGPSISPPPDAASER